VSGLEERFARELQVQRAYIAVAIGEKRSGFWSRGVVVLGIAARPAKTLPSLAPHVKVPGGVVARSVSGGMCRMN
jgi:hypothetical protein